MKLYENSSYIDDIKYTAELDLPWDRLEDKAILISGASGLIGSFLVDVLAYRNINNGMNCVIYAVGRSEEKAYSRFQPIWDQIKFIRHDINLPLNLPDIGEIDYILHLASNTHPVAYASDPIGTITTNIIGTGNMLEFAAAHGAARCGFASSVEVYGENRGDEEFFDESYCGYIDCNTMRAGYPESKRCGEALCQAYIKQRGLDIVIPRFTRSYGPTILTNDTRAISQFIAKGAAREDIVLKSKGDQYFSYTYMSDAVSGLLTVLLRGECGEAYNISDESSDITLKDLAGLAAKNAGTRVVFELPDKVESSGYSKSTKARIDGGKLKSLGWKPRYSIEEGINKTIRILRETG